MKVSIFKDVKTPENPQHIDLIEYLNLTKIGEWEDIVTKCRNIKDKDERDSFKRTMQTTCLSGVFSYRNDKSLVTHNEILAMDLDEVDNLSELHEKFKKDKYVFSSFMSTSGFGLRVLFKINPEKHSISFKSILQYIFEKYGEPCDVNSSISKPYIVSFDPDLYLNEDAEIFKKYIKETVVKNIPSYIHNNEDFENVFNQIIGRRIDITLGYDDWVRIGFGLAEQYGENGRYYFHELSRISDKYNYNKCNKQFDYCLRSRDGKKVNIRTFYYIAKSNGISISSERTKQIVRVTRNGKKAGLKPEQISTNLKDKASIDGADEFIKNVYESEEKFEDSEDQIESLEMFIKNSYNLRFNEVSGYFEDDGRQINPTAMNSIFIAAKKLMPKMSYDLMIRLLKSDFVPHFNPFYEFFRSDGIAVYYPPIPQDNNSKFKTPLMDKLSECIVNDKEAFTRYFLRKWLVSIVSAAHYVHSPLLFCLLGAQNTGKTEFFRRLTPKELIHYYAESKLDKEKDDELLMTECLIIMDDELGGKSKSDALKLKNITSKQHFSLRRPYGDHNERIARIAVLCGTSNYSQVMSDPTGNRRIIPVEVIDIDKEKYNSINKRDLFMEMYSVYKQGFDWRIGNKDLRLLNQDEERYTMTSRERDLIMRFFEQTEDKDAKRMSSTDILVEIEKLTNQKLNINSIGRELENLNFVRKSTRFGTDNKSVRQMWLVKEINRFNNPSNYSEPMPF